MTSAVEKTVLMLKICAGGKVAGGRKKGKIKREIKAEGEKREYKREN